MTRADVEAVLPHLPEARLVLLSSMDVYHAFGLVLDDLEGEGLPLTEASRLREQRYPYRERGERPSDYDKLDVEPAYLARGACVLRLAMIYGEHDRALPHVRWGLPAAAERLSLQVVPRVGHGLGRRELPFGWLSHHAPTTDGWVTELEAWLARHSSLGPRGSANAP